MAQLEDVRSVFITGSTGFLGAFLLADIVEKCPDIIAYCLVRAGSSMHMRENPSLCPAKGDI